MNKNISSKDALWEKIVETRALLSQYNKNYRLGNPDISDIEYDNFLRKYREDLSLYYDVAIDETDVENMSSVNSTYDIKDVYSFDHRVRKTVKDPKYIFEPKVDGVSITFVYRKGYLDNAFCKGKSSNVLPIVITRCKKIPMFYEPWKDINVIYIKAEICISRDYFNNNTSIDFVSARNMVAGILMTKNNSMHKDIALNALVFDVDERIDISHEQRMKQIEGCFEVMPNILTTNSINEEELTNALNFCKQWKYFCDGLVIKLDDSSHRSTLGNTASAPRWIFGLKYVRELYKCILLDVEFDLGRTGRLTILGIVDLFIERRHITRINMHSMSFIKRNNIKIGDIINIEYRGDAVPIFENVHQSCGMKSIIVDSKCMFCSSNLEEKGEHIFCSNIRCSRRCYRNLLYQIQSIDIDMFGNQVIRKMSQRGIKDIIDIEKLNMMDLASFSSSFVNAKKMYDSFHSSISSLTANKLLLVFGISLLGSTAATKISNICKDKKYTFRDFIEHFKYNDWYLILGKKLCDNILEFLHSVENFDSIQGFLQRFGDLVFS